MTFAKFEIERNKRTNGYTCVFKCCGKRYYASTAIVFGFPLEDWWDCYDGDEDEGNPKIGETMIFPYPEGANRPDFGNEVYSERYPRADVLKSRLLYDIERFCLYEKR